MDKRLAAALDFSNYRLTLANQKINLRQRAEIQKLVNHNNGIFTSTPEIMGYIQYLISSDFEQQVFLDNNETPILIKDLPTFLEKLNSAYTMAMNEFFIENEKIKKQRNVKSLTNVTD
jgi:hypothetical protein